jgi:hypothetical protein
MLTLAIDHPDPMAALRRHGIDARLAWNGDADSPALVLVEPDRENIRRLETWAGGEVTRDKRTYRVCLNFTSRLIASNHLNGHGFRFFFCRRMIISDAAERGAHTLKRLARDLGRIWRLDPNGRGRSTTRRP